MSPLAPANMRKLNHFLTFALFLQLIAVLNLLSSKPVFSLIFADPPPASMCLNLQPSPDLPQFLDPLTFPPMIDLSQGHTVALGAYKISINVHSQLPNTTLYGWGLSQDTATVPGPTLLAKQHVPAQVNWENHLTDMRHMMPLDASIEWANPEKGGVPIVPHLHGGETQPMYDGNPDAWFTAFGDTGSAFITQNYTYINEQHPSTLWYHDHTVGITRLNQVAGLAGMYILQSDAEQAILPIGHTLEINDRQFFPNGSINFPKDVNRPDVLRHIWCPEYYGDTILVNGKAWPYLKVLPRPYRFRILNSCNARFLVLSLSQPGLLFYQIGTDGGFLEEQMNVSSLTLSPSERVDCIIDFSPLTAGTFVFLNNTGPTPFPLDNLTTNPPKSFAAMQFIIDDEDGLADGIVDLPIDLSSLVQEYLPLSENEATVTRRLTVREIDIENTVSPLQYVLDNNTWTNKTASEKPIQGSTEIWELVNPRDNGHAVHIHLTQFRVLNQQEISGDDFLNEKCSLDVEYGTSGSFFTTRAKQPLEYQRGWKDTVVLWPGNVTRIILRFTQRNGSSFGFDPTEEPGYVWHCHVSGHEDWSMMRPLKIQPPNTTILFSSSNSTATTSIA